MRIRVKADGPFWKGIYRGRRNYVTGEVLEGREADSAYEAWPDDFEVLDNEPYQNRMMTTTTAATEAPRRRRGRPPKVRPPEG